MGLLADDISREQLARANGRLAHRGPDDDGLFMGDGVGLAARRLSIIDLAGGHQPLSNETGDIWIAYNGEVMNAPARRAELQAAGHQFRTRSDTEVIVHAYEQWGDDCVTRLDGMFAFGLWDGRSPHQPRLLLSRDRFGIKPLHYAQSGARFAFASAIRPLFDLLPSLPRQADRQAMAHLFRRGWVPTPLTMFAGVKQLPAAHLLVVERGQVTIRPYWTLHFPPADEHARLDEREAVAQFLAHLREAVAAWRMSDVPVGSLLSGGVDSGALAALLTELSGPIHTFHIAFAAASHDESAYAAQTAQAIGSRHHTLTFTNADFDHLPDVVRHLESPQCSATSIPIYLLYRACREAGFKVILTGEGADELLGGYHWFDGDRRVRPFLLRPRPLRQLAARLPLPISTAGRRALANG
ncbi:MAG: asparagine synthase (glutamine-hydrolyzing), partial [Anaerolineae bacterium]